MKSSHHTTWQLGFFFWIFGFGIFSLPSLADLSGDSMTKTAFEYLLSKNTSDYEISHLLSNTLSLNIRISKGSEDIPVAQYLFEQNRVFLLNKKDSTPATVFSNDIKIVQDAAYYTSLDVWEFLDGFADREKGVHQYIDWGKTLLHAIDQNDIQKDEQVTELKSQISGHNKSLKERSAAYSKAVESGDAVAMETLKSQKAEIAHTISLLESQLEEVNKRTKSITSYQKTIKNLVQGAEENRDALIKNVKVKSPSGSYIKAIETK